MKDEDRAIKMIKVQSVRPVVILMRAAGLIQNCEIPPSWGWLSITLKASNTDSNGKIGLVGYHPTITGVIQ